MSKASTIRLKLVELRPDPLQYKPYSPTLVPDEVYLDVELPKGMVTEREELKQMTSSGPSGVRVVIPQVITLDGYKYLMALLADAVVEMHDERMKERAKA